MAIRYFIFLIPIYILQACCKCEEDVYGDHLEMIVPVQSYPNVDTFRIGDTIWFDIDMDKNVELQNNEQTIFLENFDFITDFFIIEISDTFENYNVNIDTVVLAGKMQKLPLATAVVYPLKFDENADSYKFKAGVILQNPGLFWLGLSTSHVFFENVEHPALYVCKSRKRHRVDVYYHNSSTRQEAFEDLFMLTNADYLKALTSYEEYKNVGSITILVRE